MVTDSGMTFVHALPELQRDELNKAAGLNIGAASFQV
jgi:hypothetical protein